MRNLIFEKDKMSEKSDITKSDSENDSSTDNFHIANHPCEIMDLRHVLQDKIDRNEIFCSFEVVSTRKPKRFYQRLLEEMDKYSPLFYALTWHEEAVADNKNYLSLNLARYFPPNTLLHLAANNLKRDEVIHILRKALVIGKINIFALRGDSISEDGDFKHAADLVAFIREQFGDRFCICVAGYPQMHPESSTKELDLYYLKAKVDAGADFIITQICFESQTIIEFINNCRKIDIQIPIIPGIFAPMSYECFEKMARICKLNIPVKIKNDFLQMKDNAGVEKLAISLAVQIMADIIRSGITRGFHLFTLNRLLSMAEIYKYIEFLKTKLDSM